MLKAFTFITIIILSSYGECRHKRVGVTSVVTDITNLLTTVVNGIVTLVYDLINAVAKLLNGVLGTDITPCVKVTFLSMQSILNNIVKMTLGHIPFVGDTIVRAITGGDNKNTFSLTSLLKSGLDIIHNLLESLASIAKAAISVFNPFKGLTGTFQNAIDKVKDLSQHAVSELGKIIDSSKGGFFPTFKPIQGIGNITDKFKNLTEPIGSNLGKLIDSSKGSTFIPTLKPIQGIGNITDKFKNLTEPIGSNLGKITGNLLPHHPGA